jgi:colicin import membrane protein
VKDTGTSTGLSSWSLSILLHVLVVAALAGAWFWHRSPAPAEQRLAIEASVITSTPVQTSAPAAAPEPAPEPPAAPEPEPEDPAAEQAEREAEAKRAEAERVAEQRRVAEARLAAQLKAEQAAREKKDREAKEREQKEREDRERVERERVARERAEQLRRQREQADMEARLQREAEINAQLAAEQRIAAARAGAAGQQYIRQIAAHIERRWNRPPGATPGTQCEVRVTQAQGGVVTRVEVGRCNRDETVRQSIEDAVLRASPLPQPSDPALFDRNLIITFRPEN